MATDENTARLLEQKQRGDRITMFFADPAVAAAQEKMREGLIAAFVATKAEDVETLRAIRIRWSFLEVFFNELRQVMTTGKLAANALEKQRKR